MSATQQHHSSEHEHYFVPAKSRLPIITAFAMFVLVFGSARLFVDMSQNKDSIGEWILLAGFMLLAWVLFVWFSHIIKENQAGLAGPQLNRSYVWGMGWFIFSEVMFFAAFFGALFYVRTFAGPWIGGEGAKGATNMLYEGFKYSWPMLSNPDNSQFTPPQGVIHGMGLPALNTLILIASSFTLTMAHYSLKLSERTELVRWMGLTVALGIVFLILQITEYYEAYSHLGLTLASGIYGSTFFMLTGFHGAHVTIGTLMLIVQLVRCQQGHFSEHDHFGFEASAWYWHFVDVVWICLFVFVYLF